MEEPWPPDLGLERKRDPFVVLSETRQGPQRLMKCRSCLSNLLLEPIATMLG